MLLNIVESLRDLPKATALGRWAESELSGCSKAVLPTRLSPDAWLPAGLASKIQ